MPSGNHHIQINQQPNQQPNSNSFRDIRELFGISNIAYNENQE